MFDFEPGCANDPMFGQLWGLKNTLKGEVCINACDAWVITTGAKTRVAVVDIPIDTSHNDLSRNIDAVFDTQNGTGNYSPASIGHGTHVCGTVAAVKDNNLQVAGVAPNSRILGVSHDLYPNPEASAQLAGGISWAWREGLADVITNSWGDQGGRLYDDLYSEALDNAIADAIAQGRGGKGCIVIFIAGNKAPAMDYPGNSNNDILTVGSVGRGGIRSSFSAYGDDLDVVAPGEDILSTIPNNGTSNGTGTSMAAPHAAGVAALVLSANPDLTGQQVRDIIESTAQQVGDYGYQDEPSRPDWNEYVGYGLVDAHAAVLAAQATLSPKLLIRDDIRDDGIEPNPNGYSGRSPDIWLEDAYGNPLTSPPSNPSCVLAVRIHNKGPVASDGTDRLHLYWSRVSLGSAYPGSWDGSQSFACSNGGTLLKGDRITPIRGLLIPSIPAQGSRVVRTPFTIPEENCIPAGSQSITEWGLGILAHINHLNYDDPSVLSPSTSAFVERFNRAAVNWDCYNPYSHFSLFSIDPVWHGPVSLSITQPEEGAINDYAEVYASLSPGLMELWEEYGADGIGFEPQEDGKLLLTSEVAELHFSQPLPETESLYFIETEVHFISDIIPQTNEFEVDIAVLDENREMLDKTILTAIRSEARYFEALVENSNDEVMKNESVTLTARSIGEEATYTWYDANGNMVGDSREITIAPATTQSYTLEVQAVADAYKSYDSLGVAVKEGIITYITPNPANTQVTVGYALSEEINAASLVFISSMGVTAASYPLTIGAESKEVQLSGFTSGYYTVNLISGGKVLDSKVLIVK